VEERIQFERKAGQIRRLEMAVLKDVDETKEDGLGGGSRDWEP